MIRATVRGALACGQYVEEVHNFREMSSRRLVLRARRRGQWVGVAAESIPDGAAVEIQPNGLVSRAGFVRERDCPHPTLRDLFPVTTICGVEVHHAEWVPPPDGNMHYVVPMTPALREILGTEYPPTWRTR